jgi:hypothetical protein
MPCLSFIVNGVKLIDSRIQPVADANYALLDTGNPILAMASDVLAQITNAWAANPDVSIGAVLEHQHSFQH